MLKPDFFAKGEKSARCRCLQRVVGSHADLGKLVREASRFGRQVSWAAWANVKECVSFRDTSIDVSGECLFRVDRTREPQASEVVSAQTELS